jgi:hypothetical protein
MKKQYHLKLESYQAIYDYQTFLKEKEDKAQQELEDANPDLLRYINLKH